MASAAYNGDILIWSLETGSLLFCLNVTKSNYPQTLVSNTSSGYYSAPVEPEESKPASQRYSLTPNWRRTDDERMPSMIMNPPKLTFVSLARDGTLSRLEEENENMKTGESEKTAEDGVRDRGSSSETTKQRKGFGRPLKKEDCVVEKLLFLQSRENTAGTATLLSGHVDGLIRAWSVHHKGGLLGIFLASHKPGEPVMGMATDDKNHYLVTGDHAGYIKVWYINNYCNNAPDPNAKSPNKVDFPFLNWTNRVKKHEKTTSWVATHAQDKTHPPLLTSFKGHLQAVISLDIADVDGEFYIVTTSVDNSIRLWTLAGAFMGIFGQSSMWNAQKCFGAPEETTDDSDNGRNSLTATLRSGVMLPPDVRRVASATTLSVFYGDRHPVWLIAKNVICWLNQAKKPMPKDGKSKDAKQAAKKLRKLSDVNEGSGLSLLVSEGSSILGKSYKRTTRHRPLPTLPKIYQISNKVRMHLNVIH